MFLNVQCEQSTYVADGAWSMSLLQKMNVSGEPSVLCPLNEALTLA